VIVFSMRVVTPDEVRPALLRTLGLLLGPTRVTPGCRSARIYAELDGGKVVVLIEEWETREQFDEQLNTEKLKTLVAAIELSSEAPMVCIDTVTREKGVEFLGRRPSRTRALRS
jgi:quinol monooxygenase YgiN